MKLFFFRLIVFCPFFFFFFSRLRQRFWRNATRHANVINGLWISVMLSNHPIKIERLPSKYAISESVFMEMLSHTHSHASPICDWECLINIVVGKIDATNRGIWEIFNLPAPEDRRTGRPKERAKNKKKDEAKLIRSTKIQASSSPLMTACGPRQQTVRPESGENTERGKIPAFV